MEKFLRFLGLQPRWEVSIWEYFPNGTPCACSVGQFVTRKAANRRVSALLHAPETIEVTGVLRVTPL